MMDVCVVKLKGMTTRALEASLPEQNFGESLDQAVEDTHPAAYSETDTETDYLHAVDMTVHRPQATLLAILFQSSG